MRADAGYVTVAAPRDSLALIETRLLEAVKRPLEEVWDAVGRARALAIGPGLGRGAEQRTLVRRLLVETDLPAVVDADALYGLEPFERAAPTVLTPHSGELGRLLGEESAWVDAHRLEAVRRAVERFGCTVLLKGADTIVAAPGGADARRRARAAVAGHRRHRRRAHGDRRGVPRQGTRRAPRRGRRRGRHGLAAARLPRPGLVAGDLLDSLPHVLASA